MKYLKVNNRAIKGCSKDISALKSVFLVAATLFSLSLFMVGTIPVRAATTSAHTPGSAHSSLESMPTNSQNYASFIIAETTPSPLLISRAPKYVIKSLFFLPVLFLLAFALVYAVKSLQKFRKLTVYAKNTNRILTTQEALNDYLALVMSSLDGIVEKIHKDIASYVQLSGETGGQQSKLLQEIKAFKDTTGQLFTANQVSSSQSANTTKQITYSLPKLFKKRLVYIPIVLALILTILLNIVLYVNNAIKITLSSAFVTMGVVLFAGLLVALAYRYLCYTSMLENRNSKQLKQVSLLYEQRTEFIRDATSKISDRIAFIKKAKETLDDNNLKNSLQSLSSVETIYHSLCNVRQYCDFNKDAPLFDISSFSKNTIKEYAVKYKDKQISIIPNIDSGIVTNVSPAEFRQIFESLLSNACEFSLTKGVVTVSVTRSLGKVIVSVSDKGVGIPGQKLPGLIKPFSGKAENSHDALSKKPSLSLYMDKIIINKLGGNFKISSTVGDGTKVTVQLPIHRIAVQNNPLAFAD